MCLDAKIFDILYSYLEEQSDNTVYHQLNTGSDYQKTLTEESECYQQHENLNLNRFLSITIIKSMFFSSESTICLG